MSIISVIVPVYNVEKYLEKCICNILCQTYSEIEVILVNDGSSDKSEGICTHFSKIDNRIRVIHIPNSGVSNARNIGIEHARGKYIHFIDSDDFINETLIEDLYSALQTNNSDFVMCGYYKIRDNNEGREIKTAFKCAPYSGVINGFLENIISYFYPPILQGPCWKLFKRDIILKNKIEFNKNMNFGEDTDFVLRYLRNCETVTCVDISPYYYRVHGNQSLSSKFNTKKIDVYIYLAEQLRELESIKLKRITNHSDIIICNSFISYINELILTQNDRTESEIIRIIDDAMSKQEIQESFSHLKLSSVKFFLIYVLLKVNYPMIVNIVFKLKFFINCLIRRIK